MSMLLSIESWIKTCLESLFFWEKNPAYVLGYFEFVFLRKTWKVATVKLQVCNLILLSAAALSNRKSDLLDF